MRFRVSTLMVLVSLLALGFASPNPVLATTLIFTCPLWLLVLTAKSRSRNSESGPRESPPIG